MSTTVSRPAVSTTPALLRDPRADHHPRWSAGERLHHLFEQVCDELAISGRADHAAVEVETEEDGPRHISYLELDEDANRLARHLVTIGVEPGQRIALLLDDPRLAYLAMLAALKVHAAYVPLDVGYPEDRLAFIVADAQASLLLTRSDLRPLLAGTGVPMVCVDEIGAELAASPGHRLGADEVGAPVDELAYIIYTSGSTGRPKGVAIEHASICNFVRVAAEVYGIRDGDRMYQGMTIAFDFSVEEIWVPWMCRATLVPRPAGGSLLGADLHAFLTERRITAMACVPTLLATLDDDLAHLRFLLVSGEACPQDLVARWWREDRRFLNVYGPTEATVSATWALMHPERPVTIGTPLPTYSCVVLDPQTGEALPPGATGELGIAGIGLAAGYVNRPDLTEKAFVPDLVGLPDNPSTRVYRTGDLVRIRPDDEIEYLGRIDLQVKIRGYRIELTEIESALMQAPGVAQAVVTTHAVEPGVVELAGFVTRHQHVDGLDLDAVLGFLRDRLPPYMVPAYLDELAAIPLLPSDKADRKALPAPSTRRASGTSDRVAPRTETEATLAALLAETLGVDDVCVLSHLFHDLGANSLLMARFCSRVRCLEGFPALSMREVYLHPTVEQLAGRVDELTAGGTVGEQVPDAVAALAAGGRAAAGELVGGPTDRVPPPRRSRVAYTATGLAQLAVMLTGMWITAAVAVRLYQFIDAAPTLPVTYARAALASSALVVAVEVLTVATKWLLIGRWTAREIPLWSLEHLRFWIASRIQLASPLSAFVGSPLQVLHLRTLGARIGPGAVLLTRSPVCTDLLTIGARAVVRQEALLTTYRPESGRLRTGPIVIGPDAVVGERCVLDIDTQMGPGSRLLHASSLHRGQAIPAGAVWHGSPARPADVTAPPVPVQPVRRWRRVTYPIGQLLMLTLVPGPVTFLVAKWLLTNLSLSGEEGALLRHLGPAVALVSAPFLGELLVASSLLYVLVVAVGLAGTFIVPRLVSLGLRPDTDYPLLGWRYTLARWLVRSSNITFHMELFGDSSYIVGYLRMLGWRVDRTENTGSNFGQSQKHETPFGVSIGSGTMVSDGLHVLNADYGPTAFRLRRAAIGASCFLGNHIAYPADARTGDNCLFGTKVAVPVDGPVREGVGLLGSPAFEIPRSVARDHDLAFPELHDADLRARRLTAKNRHNLRTMAMFLGLGWSRLTVALFVLIAVSRLPLDIVTRFWLASVLAFVAELALWVLVERTVLRFRRLHPTTCSLYDRRFWHHERYWKLSVFRPLAMLAGTPMRPLLLRVLGLKVGTGVFDEGCGIPERSLVTIGDWVSLGVATTIQAHSLEDAMFKSDHVVIGSGVVIGAAGFVHYGTTIGDGAVIEPDSFLMKGHEVLPGERWVGNPAQAGSPAP
ncbi:MAG TPA: Pls/PosA family non-ribosomal peptide synthetase [Kineosporiaceae bacterium]|nr:Pls/PosA family non-ribosomal peptide synthetase [Kineosporiaceae bacterium]